MTTLTQRLRAARQTAVQLQLSHLVLIMSLVLLVWRIPYYGQIVLDDPYITFRYVDNLLQRGQFVFNPGEFVLATTTPLFAAVLAVFRVVGLPLPLVATVLNLALEAALLWVIARIIAATTLPHRQQLLAFTVAALLTLSNRALSIASNSGMETVFFTLLNYLTLLQTLNRRYRWGAVTGALATLTRPDGIFVLVVLGLTVLIRERRLPLAEVGISLLIGGPWAVIAWQTYGSFIPQSVTAKDAIRELWSTSPGTKAYVILFEPLRWFGIAAAPLLLTGLYWGGTQLQRLWPLLAFIGLHLIYALLPSNLGFDWYFVPLFVGMNLFVGLGLAVLAERTRWAWLLGAVVALGFVYSSLGNYASVRSIDPNWRSGMLQAVAYLNQNAAPDAVIQCTNIGIVSYYTGRPILDPLGLASPQVTPKFDQSANLSQLNQNVVATYQPDYIVSFGPENYAGYTVVASFPMTVGELIVYQRSRAG